MSKVKLSILLSLPFLLLMGFLGYNLPPVKDRIDWRIKELEARIKYAVSPPAKVVFIPQDQGREARTEIRPVHPLYPTYTPGAQTPATPNPLPIGQAAAPETGSTGRMNPASLQPESSPAPIPLPENTRLAGIRHEYQGWNNCGPTTLGMALSYWGWKGDQYKIASFVKPNPRDNNVMPAELVDYVETQTDLKAVTRVGGDLNLLKQFIAAGLPVMIEKGFEGINFEGWMGHYELVNGYEDASSLFTVQDSYLGPDQELPYDQAEAYWRAFNYVYLVVYPEDRQAQVMSILGSQADPAYNAQYAAGKASADIPALQGRDLFFAWFNRGSSLVALQDYTQAAEAYDQAFSIYPSIPEELRPWRMLWYQTGPYLAYFYTGRYRDVVDLASKTLGNLSETVLEESYYWRARGRQALGDTPGAIKDLKASLKARPGYQPAVELMQTIKGK